MAHIAERVITHYSGIAFALRSDDVRRHPAPRRDARRDATADALRRAAHLREDPQHGAGRARGRPATGPRCSSRRSRSARASPSTAPRGEELSVELAAEYEQVDAEIAAPGAAAARPRRAAGRGHRRGADPGRGPPVLPQPGRAAVGDATGCRSRPGPMTWDPVRVRPAPSGGPSRAWSCASPTTVRCSAAAATSSAATSTIPSAPPRRSTPTAGSHTGDIGAARRRRLPPHRRPQEGAHHHRGRQEHLAREPRGRAQGAAADRSGVRGRRGRAVPRRAARARSRRRARRGRRATASPGTTLAELAVDPVVHAEVEREVAVANERFSHVEPSASSRVLPAEWLPDSEELTPTMKLKRRGIAAKYAARDRRALPADGQAG